MPRPVRIPRTVANERPIRTRLILMAIWPRILVLPMGFSIILIRRSHTAAGVGKICELFEETATHRMSRAEIEIKVNTTSLIFCFVLIFIALLSISWCSFQLYPTPNKESPP